MPEKSQAEGAARVFVTAVAAAFLAACAGNFGIAPQSLQAPSPALRPQDDARVTAAMRVIIPAARASRAFFVAATTQGIDVTVTAAGSTTILAQVRASLASGSSACRTLSDGSRVCSIPIPVPAGDDRFAFRTYDAPPTAHGGFERAKLLGVGSLAEKIALGSSHSFSISIGGVVESLEIALPFPNIHGTEPSSQTLGIFARDADGNVIVSDGYYDKLGNPLNVAISLGTPHGKFGGTLALRTSTLSSPSADGVPLTYDGRAGMPAVGDSGAFSSTVSLDASTDDNGKPTGIAPVSTALHVVGPSVETYAVAAGSQPYQFALGGDGNVWFTDRGTGKIGTISPSGSARELLFTRHNEQPDGIALGQDGYLWFAVTHSGQIGRIDPAHARGKTLFRRDRTDGNRGPPDGSVWFTEPGNNTLAKISSSGKIVRFPALKVPHSYPYRITAGSDGNMWFTQSLAGRIGVMTVSGNS